MEIITLHLGRESNFVASHYWNIQLKSFEYSEAHNHYELNHDILWRCSEAQKATKYTPRALFIDLKENFGPLSSEGRMAVDSEETPKPEISTWGGATHSFVDNEMDTETYWSSLLNMELSHKSVSKVKMAAGESLETFNDGLTLMNNTYFSDDLSDQLRCLIEECDTIQGIQLITDGRRGFSGVTSALLEKVEDEVGKFVTFTFALDQSKSQVTTHPELPIHVREDRDVLNEMQSVYGLSQRSSVYTRLDLDVPWLQAHHHDSSHYSIIAAALDTATLPYRMHERGVNMPAVAHHLSSQNKTQLCTLSSSYPVHVSPNLLQDLQQKDASQLNPLKMQDFCPVSSGASVRAEVFTFRGIDRSQNLAQAQVDLTRLRMPFRSDCYVVQQPFVAPPKFSSFDTRSIIAQLRNTTGIYNSLDVIFQKTKKINIAKYHNWDADEFHQMRNDFGEIVSNYTSDDDDL